ncbi:MAG: pantoate--beta-alanine ligase [Planctomycetota bacterium]|jgi:pantoate--beta-alanine ligase
MIIFEAVPQAESWCQSVRARGLSLGMVPTMGALHDGHLQLVSRSIKENDRTCVSVFVNPLQFNDPADLERYPRDFESDTRSLEELGCSMAFTGTPDEFFGKSFAQGDQQELLLEPGPIAEGLEGTERPGHFAGVATVVDRLFQIASPTRAYFGRKDFQQCMVVQDLARSRGGPEIVLCPTVREASGLAMSSRNLRLSPVERARALSLSQALRAARQCWDAGERGPGRLADALQRVLSAQPEIEVEYAEIRDPEAWSVQRPTHELERAVALLAVRVGPVRLIDNLRLDDPSDPMPAETTAPASVEQPS